MVLRSMSANVVALEEDNAVVQVSVAVVTECDACGQQECVWLHVCFTPGPDENPLVQDLHQKDNWYCFSQCLLQLVFD